MVLKVPRYHNDTFMDVVSKQTLLEILTVMKESDDLVV